MAARLEVEITGNNTKLKNVLKDTLSAVNSFSKAFDANKLSGFLNQQIAINKSASQYVDVSRRQKSAVDDLTSALQRQADAQRNSLSSVASGYSAATGAANTFRSSVDSSSASIRNQSSATKGLSSSIASLAGGYLSLHGAISILKQVIHTNAEVSDGMADVRRTAKLTAQQTDDLAESLKGINTRTDLAGLLDIGYIGGQLGVGNKDLKGFITQIDQLSVILKKEFPGGADAVATSLGKIISVYQLTTKGGLSLEESLSKVGSALLGIAHDGPVNVDFLQDFTLRTAGAAQIAKLSLPTMLAYGAVLSEAGVKAQVAASSVNRLISSLAGKREKFLTIAQLADSTITLEKFTKLINTDSKAALDLFFRGLKQGNPSQTEFNDRLSTLGFKVGAATNSITQLALRQGELSKKVAVGNHAYEEASLVAENFAIKNDTLGASIDKLGKTFENLTTSSNIISFFKAIVDGISYSIQAVKDFNDAVSKTQAEKDYELVQNNSGKFVIPSDDPKEREELRQARGRVKARYAQSLKEEIIGGANNSIDIKTIGKTEEQVRLMLVNATKKQIAAQKELNYNIAFIKNPLNTGAPFESAVSNTNKLRVNLVRQIALVDRLKSKLPAVALPELTTGNFAKKEKTKKEKSEPVNRAEEILRQSSAGVDLTGLTGTDKQVEEVRLKYEKFYADLMDNAQKSTAGRATLEKDLLTLQRNEGAENTKIISGEKQRQVDEIQRINNIEAVKSAESRQADLADIEKRYDAEILKAGDASNIIAALKEAKIRETDAVNSKYVQKRIDEEQNISDAIQRIYDKDFTVNENFSKKITSRNKAALKERLADITEQFDKLRKLYSTNPLALMGLNVGEQVVKNATTGNQQSAEKAGSAKIFEDFVTGFGDKFYKTLSSINEQADRSFGYIVASLGSSITEVLNDTFSNQLKVILKDLVSGVKISTTQALSAIAGLAGGLISGVTNKTSSLGQATGGALTGAASGALAGSVVPGIGTAAGGIIGGVIGAIGGLFSSSKARKEQEELQKQQLEEAKKQTELLRQNALTYTSAITGRMTDQGILTNVDIGAMGELKATVSGKQLDFILARNNQSRG